MSRKEMRELAARLEQIEKGESTLESILQTEPEIGRELAELLGTADAVRRSAAASPPDDFRENARIRVLNHAAAGISRDRSERAGEPRTAVVLELRRLFYGLAVVVGMLFVGVLGSIPMQNALPGDMLYPGKLALENLQLLASPATEDPILQTRFASNRLTEIQLLIVQARFDDVDLAVDGYEENINRAVLALAEVARQDGKQTYPILKHIEMELDSYSMTLTELLAFVPGSTQVALARAIEASRVWSGETN